MLTPWATVWGFLRGLTWKWPELSVLCLGEDAAQRGGQRGGPGGLEGQEEPRACHILTEGLATHRSESRREGSKWGCVWGSVWGPCPMISHRHDWPCPPIESLPSMSSGCRSLQRQCALAPALTGSKPLHLAEPQFPLLVRGVDNIYLLRLNVRGCGLHYKTGRGGQVPCSWAGGVLED